MPVTHVVVTMVKTSGNPDDEVEMTFDFDSLNPFDGPTFVEGIESFFNDVNEHLAISDYIQETVARGLTPHRWAAYDVTDHLDGSAVGAGPIAVGEWSMAAGPAVPGAAPAELAAVITEYGEGRADAPVRVPNPALPGKFTRPKQRHTGHLYVGPLNGNALGLIDGDYRLTDNIREDLAVAAARARNVWFPSGFAMIWSVWSRADGVTYHIEAVAIDNAPDTQRRRGVRSTRKTVNSVFAP